MLLKVKVDIYHGKVRHISQVSDNLGKSMHLTKDELAETYETCGQNRHYSR